MAIKIDKKIVGYDVNTLDQAAEEGAKAPAAKANGANGANGANEPNANEPNANEPNANEQMQLNDGEEQNKATIVQMHEKVARPEMLVGSTYKVKTPLSDHALYVTINDIILNPDTPYEKRRPFEIFINSKNMDHFQWIVALTRIISAVFRKGGDVTFLVEELRSVFDPKGGYFKRGGKYMPSLVAEIGDAIECHMKAIGMIKDDTLDEHQQKLVEQKRKEFEQLEAEPQSVDEGTTDFPKGSTLCTKCQTKAMIMMDGCLTCLNCGESKCG